MPSSYTPSLRLTLPVTGELSGTWGNTVNSGITNLLDSAVAGTAAVTMTDADYTLTTANGATDEARKMFVTLTGTLTAARNVICPSASKLYFIKNTTTGGFAVTLKTSAGTGISVPNGKSMVLYCNGTDVIDATNHYSSITLATALPVLSGGTGTTTSTGTGSVVLSNSPTLVTPALGTPSSGVLTNATGLPLTTGVTGTLPAANGGTGQSSYTTGDLIYASGATALSKLGVGTAGQVLTSSGTAPQWTTISGVAVTTFSAGTTGFTPSTATSGAVTLGGTLATTNGGTGLTSFTANGVVYASSTSALATGSALTFDGTNLSNAGRYVVNVAGSAAGTTDISLGALSGGAFLNTPSGTTGYLAVAGNAALAYSSSQQIWYASGSEQMRLTSTGLGIGTSSPGYKLHVAASASTAGYFTSTGSVTTVDLDNTNANGWGSNIAIRTGGIAAGYFGTIGSLLGSTAQDLAVYATEGNGFRVYTNGNNLRATFDSSGNLGLGVTPSASWPSGTQAFQFGPSSALYNPGSDSRAVLSSNAIFTSGVSTATYITSNAAAYYDQDNGTHKWYTAPSGTAGNAITFTQAMTLDSSGNLGIGTSSPAASLVVLKGAAGADVAHLLNAGGYGARFQSQTGGSGTNSMIYVASGESLSLGTNNTERMRLDPSGNLGIGTSSPGAKLDVSSGYIISGTAASTNGSKILGGYYTSGNLATFGGEFSNGGPVIGYGVWPSTSAAGSFVSSTTINVQRGAYTILGANHIWYGGGVQTVAIDSAVTTTERMRLDTLGNLGIGTASPSYKLQLTNSTAVDTETGVSNSAGLSRFGTRASGNSFAGSFTAGKSLELWSAGSLNATLDASGNLGLGVTPSAWNSGLRAIQVGYSASIDSTTSVANTRWSNNAFVDSSGGFKYINTAVAQVYEQDNNGKHIFYTAPSGTAGNAISFTQAMTLDASGNLLVGRTSGSALFGTTMYVGAAGGTGTVSVPGGYIFSNTTNDLRYAAGSSASGAHIFSSAFSATEYARIDSSGNLGLGVTPSASSGASKVFEVGSAGNTIRAGANDVWLTGNAYFNTGWKYGTNTFATAYNQTSGTHAWYTAPSGTAGNAISFTQAMTLEASGNLLVGTTSTFASGLLCVNGPISSYGNQINWNNAGSTIEFVNRDSGGSKTFSWYYQASAAGFPATLSTSGVWTNASDARGKENIANINYGLDTVMALTPRQYDVKSDGSHAIGFVAQEVLPIVPELVHVTKRDEANEFYGLDYGSMTAVLVKAIQEQQALITALTARVAQLESK